MTFTIRELHLPETIGAGPIDDGDAEHFLAYVAVRNAVEADVVGTHLLTPSAAELLPEFRSNPTRRRTHFTAAVDGAVVGRAMVTTRPHTPGAGAYIMVDVLPDFRRRGIGTSLLHRVETAAHTDGEHVLKVSVAHTVTTPGERIAAPTGFGDLPASDPGAAFLLGHGYALEQVTRISVLDTAGLADRLTGLLAAARLVAGQDHRLHAWVGPTPSDWVEDIAELRTRMSTDAPMAGLQALPDPWNATRVEDHDRRLESAGQTALTTAVEHLPSGQLVGFSEIFVPSGRTAATQEDTLVLREHRGHRLGMLLKATTALDLLREAPHVEAVVTWNAEENRSMLDVNEAMGYRAIGYEGGWQKRRD